MQIFRYGLLLFAVYATANGPCFAGEYVGKLQRVDWKTITLQGKNKPMTLEVDSHVRKMAAQYLGKSVSVSFRLESGKNKVLSLKSSDNR